MLRAYFVVLVLMLLTGCDETITTAGLDVAEVKRICVEMSGEVPDADGVEPRIPSAPALVDGDCLETRYHHWDDLYIEDVAPHCTVEGGERVGRFAYRLGFSGDELLVVVRCGRPPEPLVEEVILRIKSWLQVVGVSLDGGDPYWFTLSRECVRVGGFDDCYYWDRLAIMLPVGEFALSWVDRMGQPLELCYDHSTEPFGPATSLTVLYGKGNVLAVSVTGPRCND